MMLLSLTVLTVLGAIGRSSAIEAHAAWADAWPESLIDSIRWDLANSRSLSITANSFTVGGYSSLASDGGAATHRPVLVTYSIRDLAGHGCLVRTQRTAGARQAGSEWTDLACTDIAKMSVIKLEMPARHAASSQPAVKVPVNTALMMPARVLLTLWSTSPGVAPLSRIFVVRD
jgi:hypothetical protein